MTRLRRLLLCAAGAAALCTPAVPALAASRGASQGLSPALRRSLLRSRELWATIDVCSPSDQPNTVGVRGSMPGDNEAAGRMYMSFRLQYRSASARSWVNLSGASSSFMAVGDASSARQGGWSFQLAPVAGGPASTLRGVVSFQWRKGSTVLLSVSRPTTTGHKSLAGADPADFSSASCQIG